jgi:hypothetical protein
LGQDFLKDDNKENQHECAPPITKIDQEERKGEYHARIGTQT